jgi:hypothetical protein
MIRAWGTPESCLQNPKAERNNMQLVWHIDNKAYSSENTHCCCFLEKYYKLALILLSLEGGGEVGQSRCGLHKRPGYSSLLCHRK